RRGVRTPGGAAVVELDPAAEHVRLSVWGADSGAVVARCRALFDLDADPAAIRGVLGADPLLGALVAAAPGLRVPGAVDGAELAVRAVLGQQVSVAAARTAAGRLVAACGERLAHPRGAVVALFPSAAPLGALDPASLPMP